METLATISYNKNIRYCLEIVYQSGVILFFLLITTGVALTPGLWPGIILTLPVSCFYSMTLYKFLKFRKIKFFKEHIEISDKKFPIKHITIDKKTYFHPHPTLGIVRYFDTIISEYYIWGPVSGNPTGTDYGKVLNLLKVLKSKDPHANKEVSIEFKADYNENLLRIALLILILGPIIYLTFIAANN